ncbi:hypothetical protein GFL54_15495 [Rhizobium laguerreae]|nr:hypothetical protein [Rhizobium laguerreae]NKM85674.1 hypothetical protein [Rhizobium laguerreae]
MLSAMRQFGIIEPSGNDKAWWIAGRHLLELTKAMRSSVSLGIRGGHSEFSRPSESRINNRLQPADERAALTAYKVVMANS